ncbi:MAG: hypothetical protein WD066_02540 [Planctomycetaceae bacterium]
MTLSTKPAPAPPDGPQLPARLNLTATAEIELEAAADGGGAAPLPRFQMVAYTGGPMRVGGWRYPVIVDLAGLSIPSQSRPIRFGHDATAGVGHTDSIRVEGGKLVAAGVVSRDTAAAREVVASSRNGFPWQASVGASVEEFEFVKEQQKVMVNGRQYEGPVNVVRKATLGEISFVDLGADGATSASVAAGAEPGIGDAVELPAGATLPSGGHGTPLAGAACAPSAADAAVAELRAQAAAETDRIAAARRICGGRFPRIEAQAIRDGWDAQRTELEVLRATRPAAPGIHVPDNTVTSAVLEAACVITGRLPKPEESYEHRTLELASRRFRGGIGFQELLLEAAWANGYTGRNFRDCREVLRAAFAGGLEAGFSTVDIGGILSNVANKFLLDGFYSVERTWRNVCAVRNVSDFKTVTSYRLVGNDQYELVAPGGKIKHGTLGEEKYTNQADTYGLQLTIDRREIRNDDLGAITTVPRKLGRGSGSTINDIFWKTFLANSDFFKTANQNYESGADTALGIDGLTKAEVLFMDQVDSDGKPIGVMPAIVLVPTALSAIGSQLFKSLELRETTSNAKYPVANPHQGKFRVEVSRYLANAKYAGNSAKAWYLLADPSDLPVIEVAFLDGRETPTIETADADFDELGIKMRGYHDFGVSLQDFRGGAKLKGEA